MSFIKNFSNKPAANSGGNYFADGKGKVILKDVRLFKGFSDPQTMAFDFVIKESHATTPGTTPNPVGTTAGVVKLCSGVKVLGDDARAKAIIAQIMGPDAPVDGSPEMEAELVGLLRVGADGYTKQGTLCPARGVELDYETSRATTGKGTIIIVPRFSHVIMTAEKLAENLAFLDGAAVPAANAA